MCHLSFMGRFPQITSTFYFHYYPWWYSDLSRAMHVIQSYISVYLVKLFNDVTIKKLNLSNGKWSLFISCLSSPYDHSKLFTVQFCHSSVHKHIHTVHMCSTIWEGVKNTSACGMGKTGIKPPTLLVKANCAGPWATAAQNQKLWQKSLFKTYVWRSGR